MVAGCLLVADAALRSRDAWLFMAPEGIFPLSVIQAYLSPGCWSLAFAGEPFWWQATILGLEAVAGILLAVGLCTPVASILAWIIWVSILRRTAPALNAGDYWMACLLFWSMFLPLGERWSIDARRRRAVGTATVCGLAPATFVAQVLLVYVAAGQSKLQGTWLAGTAVGYALSVHDHGTPLGAALIALPGVIPFLTWGVLALELLGPLAYCFGTKPVRRWIAVCFMLFHAGIWITMTVGLFAPVGILAWIPLLPGRHQADLATGQHPVSNKSRLGICRQACLGMAVVVALFAYSHPLLRPSRPASGWLTVPVNLLCLEQSWAMFGDVGPLEQWVTGRAVLADGRVVDLLRAGRPFVADHPPGGFSSLPNHRWHKLFWELPKQRQAALRDGVAAGLVADWNRRQPATAAVESLEIRTTRVTLSDRPAADGQPAEPVSSGVLRQWLLASWPPRGDGAGTLDRFLEKQEPDRPR